MYLLHSGSLTKINDKIKRLNIIPWRHKTDWEMPPRPNQTPHYATPLQPPVLLLWGGVRQQE